MYGKMFEQAESFLKPMSDIWALNVEVMDTLKTKQTDLFNEVVSDSLDFASGMAKSHSSIDTMFSAHQEFWGGLGEKLATNTQDNIDLMSAVPAKFGDFLKGSVAESVAVVTASTEPKAKAAPKKKAPTKKAATKTPAASKAASLESSPSN